MQADIEELEEAGVKVVAISYDSVDTLKVFVKKHEVTFPLLSDPDSETIIAYGVLNDSNPKQKIPHPTTFIVDEEQKIVAKLGKPGFAKRHTTDELLKAMASLKTDE